MPTIEQTTYVVISPNCYNSFPKGKMNKSNEGCRRTWKRGCQTILLFSIEEMRWHSDCGRSHDNSYPNYLFISYKS